MKSEKKATKITKKELTARIVCGVLALLMLGSALFILLEALL